MKHRKSFWMRNGSTANADLWSGGGEAYRAWMKAGPRGATRRGFPLGFVAIVGAALGLGAFGFPLLWATSPDSCTAFETALLRRHVGAVTGAKHQERWAVPISGGDFRSASGGWVSRQIATIEHPRLPNVISCTLLFWQARTGT